MSDATTSPAQPDQNRIGRLYAKGGLGLWLGANLVGLAWSLLQNGPLPEAAYALLGASAFAGLLMLVFALVRYKYRARWFFWAGLAITIISLPRMPIGTVVALVFLFHLIRDRAAFFADGDGPLPPPPARDDTLEADTTVIEATDPAAPTDDASATRDDTPANAPPANDSKNS